MRRCEHVKEDDKPCRAAALNGFRFCWFHEPSFEEIRKEARSNGGKNSRIFKDDVSDVSFKLHSLKDLIGFLELVINLTFKGELHPKRSNALGYLINVSRACIETGDIEDRLEKLEKVVLNARI